MSMKSRWFKLKLKRKYLLLKFLFSIMKESSNQEKLFQILGDMRGVPQKYGQFLYLKDKRKYKGFEKLLDQGIPFDKDRLYHRAVELTGGGIRLEKDPIASASIGQVYAGTLDNENVIVKVQYPNVKSELIHDWKFIKGIIGIVFKFFRFPEESKKFLVDYLKEFEETVEKETDYTQEADHQLRFQEVFKGCRHIYIPKIYESYIGEDIIVEEKCKGLPLAEFLKIAGEEEKRDVLGILMEFYFDSFFKHGILHGDPHSGNFFVNNMDGENILEIIDFGCVKVYEASYVKNLKELIVFLQKEEYEQIYSLLIHLGFHREEISSYGKALIPILNILFEPFLKDEEFDFKYWRMSYQLNTIMGSKLFDRTLSLPKELLILFRVFHGLVAHIYTLKEKSFNFYKFTH